MTSIWSAWTRSAEPRPSATRWAESPALVALRGGVHVRIRRAGATGRQRTPRHLGDTEVDAGGGSLDQQDRVADGELDVDLGAGGHGGSGDPVQTVLDRLGVRDVEARERLRGRVIRGRGQIAVAKVSLRGTILSAGPGTEEGGKCDGDQDADDEHHHHELDEREPGFLVPAPLREGYGHPGTPSMRDGRSVLRDVSAPTCPT